jgi:hypothetical protein
MRDGVGTELDVRAEGNVSMLLPDTEVPGDSLLHDDISQSVSERVAFLDELE